VSDLLTDLDSETKQALLSLYGVKDVLDSTPRKRREAGSMRSTWEGTPPRFLNLIPLLVFNENEKGKARDFFTGRKRKISGKIIHKASNVMHVHESKKLVGFQLVRPTSSQFIGVGGIGELVVPQSLLNHYSQ
jgi:amiloride-sensitive sodium channel subunit gamma